MSARDTRPARATAWESERQWVDGLLKIREANAKLLEARREIEQAALEAHIQEQFTCTP